jgi:photosystem II stability/assembly factor-like uncharacterized protein
MGGIALSTDGGLTWDAVNEGLAGRLVVGLWVSPAFPTDRTMFTTSLDQGVERSVDSGRTWEAVNEGLPTLQVPALALSPDYDRDGTLYAACSQGLYRSSDRGESWASISTDLDSVDIRAVAVSSEADPERSIFVTTSENRILRSSDGGRSWQPLKKQLDNDEVVALACSPGFSDDRVVLVGSFSIDPHDGGGTAGVWRGDEAGDKLVCQTTYRTNNRWVAFGVPTTFAGTGMFFAGIHNAVLRPMQPSVSAEGFSRRRVWKAEAVTPVSGSVVALAVSPGYADDRTLFAATSHGIFKSATGGLSWRPIEGGPKQKSTVAVVVSPDFPNDRQVFAMSLGGDLWRFVDR